MAAGEMSRYFGYRGLSLGAILVCACAFVATKHLWFDQIAPDNKALFWTNVAVAGGTLALAVVTVVSVLQTRAVISAEDRRHQQSYAPLLTLGEQFNNNEEYKAGFVLYNIGKGVAVDITFRVIGTATTETHVFPPEFWAGSISFSSEEERAAFNERHRVSRADEIDNSYFCSALADGGHDYFYQAFLAENGYAISSVHYSSCAVSYADMFGNRYETIYQDDQLRKYVWVQPKHLMIPGVVAPTSV